MSSAADIRRGVGETPWHQANQQWVVAALAALRTRLGASGSSSAASDDETDHIARSMASPPALVQLTRTFDLSPFERDILLLAAGVELDASFADAVAEAQRDARSALPTFALALAILPYPHWSALAPVRPLRHWRLIEPATTGALATRTLQIDERVLHYLVGVDYVDHRLAGAIDESGPELVIPTSQRTVASSIASAWSAAARRGEPLQLVYLRGVDIAAKQAVAWHACAELGLGLVTLSQTTALEDPLLATLVARETRLSHAALLVLADDVEPSAPAARWIDRTNAPTFLSTRDRAWPIRRPALTLDVQKPRPAEARAMWAAALEDMPVEAIEPLVSQFDLGAEAIRAAANAAAVPEGGATDERRNAVWEACRRLSRPKLDGLAQRIVTFATWDDLIVPKTLRETLELIAMQVAQRASVHEAWSFTRRGSRGLGITALFAGPSGTGKTLAAEVLSNALKLDLYRVDLSQVVSKYIGETEKNLGRVFDAAEEGAAVLLFDEADALFGKRSEVKDSHDRYANIEVSYLLQRMETYRGLAILTTNLKSAIDPAFFRRIQFVAQFPFPTLEQRLAIWTRFFPEGSNIDGLDYLQLAQMNLAGGNIYNVARNAAFLAADAGTPVRMEHVHRAARDEFAKLERPSNLPL